ncbi:MAG: T9SS C-terminal target domain-containing protein [Balneola sp.]|nr:MAG: T9SS C-terminal target domain-containing protein [Balneola sp.]
MGGVGSGTVIEYVEVYANLDDCFEWFGGTVNTKNLVGAFCGDDTYDYDQGFRGKGQFWFSIQGADETGRAGEHDGGDTNETGEPFSIPVITNVTYIGSGEGASGIGGDGNDRTFAIRDNAGGKYYNSIFTDFAGVGANIEDLDGTSDDSRGQLEEGNLVFNNNLWYGYGAGNTAEAILPQDFVRTNFVAANNQVVDPNLRGISRGTDAGLDPRLGLGSPASTGANFSFDVLDDDFFTPVIYQGAFGGSNWLAGWTAIDNAGTLGDIPLGTATNEVVITDDVTANTTWTNDNIYILDGLVFVQSGELTIQPGTIVKGRLNTNITTGEGASALIVQRGATINAQGDASNPIVFTTEVDEVEATDRGLWGGIIILGRATTNETSTNIQVEGIPAEQPAQYGGNDDTDNSGTLRYVSIRHGGFSISGVPGDEINGLTMGAVGSGTVIEFVEVFANLDDCFEWFGGTVNTRYLVGAFCGDDTYDYDQGFRGYGQYWFSIQGTDEAGRAGEHDGGDTNETGTPFSIPVISHVTYIGSGSGATGVGGDGNDRAFAIRDNAGGKYYNSIFTDFAGVGANIEDIDGSSEDSRAQVEAGNLVFENNIWYDFGAGATAADIWPQDFVETAMVAGTNQIVDPGIAGISRSTDGGLNPEVSPDGAASTSTTTDLNSTVSDWFANRGHIGAFAYNEVWIKDWTGLDDYGYLNDAVINPNEEVETDIPSEMQLSQNYPNPFNPTTNIQFALPSAQNVTLKVYNMLGQEVATLINNENLQAGSQTISFDASSLSSGVYIYRLVGANTVLTKKMTLIK